MPLYIGEEGLQKLQATPTSRLPERLASLLASSHTRVIDLFRVLDKNADGKVTKKELADALSKLGVQSTAAEIDELFYDLDPDHDGVIVFRELQLALRKRMRGAVPKRETAPSRDASPERSNAAAPSPGGARTASPARSLPARLSMPSAPVANETFPLRAPATPEDLHMLSEMIDVAAAAAVADGSAPFVRTVGLSLLKMTSAYEAVLERHNITPIEDTHYYQLLLQLSLYPQPDWRHKLQAMRAANEGYPSFMAGGATTPTKVTSPGLYTARTPNGDASDGTGWGGLDGWDGTLRNLDQLSSPRPSCRTGSHAPWLSPPGSPAGKGDVTSGVHAGLDAFGDPYGRFASGVTYPSASFPASPRASLAPYGIADNIRSVASRGTVSPERSQTAQLRAALAFDAHKLSGHEMDAFNRFRQLAWGFREWRAGALWSHTHAAEEAQAFEAAVARWMMSVSYWELRLCGRCIRSWGAFIRRLQLVGGMVQTVHRRRVWRQLRLAFEEKVAEKRKMIRSVNMWATRTLFKIFNAMRGLSMISQAFSHRSRISYLRQSFKRMSSGVAKSRGVMLFLTDADVARSLSSLRRALRLWKTKLSERALLLESKERWATSAVRSNLYYWSELTQTKLIKLHKIEFALGHYSSVLTKMIMREWRISVHHDLLAREHLMKASMYSMWCRLAQYAATRSSKVQSALRAMLHRTMHLQHVCFFGWRSRAAWKFRKRHLAASSVSFYLGRLLGPLFAAWAQLTRENVREAMLLKNATTMWEKSSIVRATHSWQAWASTRARYISIGFTIANKTIVGLLSVVMYAWFGYCDSMNAMRSHILNEMRLLRTRFWFTKLSTGISKIRNKRLLVRQMLAANRESFVLAHLHAWLELTQKKMTNRSKVQAALHWRHSGKLATAMITLLSYAEASAAHRAALELFLRAWRKNSFTRVLRQWLAMIEQAEDKQSKIESFLGHLLHKREGVALNTWRENVREKARKLLMAQRTLWRIRNRLVAHAFTAWVALIRIIQRQKGLVRKSVGRIMLRLGLEVFDAWRRHHMKKRRIRTISAAIGSKHDSSIKLDAIWQWASHAVEIEEKKMNLRRALSFLTRRLSAMTFRAWLQLMRKASTTRKRIMPFAARLLLKLQSLTFSHWFMFLESSRAYNVKLRNARRMFCSTISSRCMRGFALYARRRKFRRERNAIARNMCANGIVDRHLRDWGLAYEEKTADQRRMLAAANFFLSSSLMRAYATMKYETAAIMEIKRKCEFVFRRWRATALRQAWDHVRINLKDLELEKANLRRSVLAMMHATVGKGLRAWNWYAQCRLQVLTIMRRVMRTVQMRQVRAAWNSALEVYHSESKVQHSLGLLRLRETRSLVGHWRLLGTNWRRVRRSLVKLQTYALSSAWQSLMAYCLETREVEESAMKLALRSAAHFINFDVCRAFDAFFSFRTRRYRRKQIFWRISRPKVGRCMQTWVTVAAERSCYEQKLLKGLALLENRIQLRIVVAWRQQVVRQLVVKERVMRLLGKLVRAVIGGWARYARRQIWCRHAAALVCETRRLRICPPLLKRWAGAHRFKRSNGLALRHVFISKTRAVFTVWHHWARDQVEDREATEALEAELDAASDEAIETFNQACSRWLRVHLAYAFDGWQDIGARRAHARRLSRLALTFWSGKLAAWAFAEYAYAVRLALLERASAHYWASAAMSFALVKQWRGHAALVRAKRTKAGTALVHWATRLATIILAAWHAAAMHWRQQRLGKLASVLHYEGTLTSRVLRAWVSITAHQRWRSRQFAAAIINTLRRSTEGIFAAWAQHTRQMAVARLFAGEQGELRHNARFRGSFLDWACWAIPFASALKLMGNSKDVTRRRRAMQEWKDFHTIATYDLMIFDDGTCLGVRRSKSRFLRYWLRITKARQLRVERATMCVFDRRLRSLRNGIHNWKFNHNAKEAAMQSLRRAYAGFSEKARFACMMSWKQHAVARFDAEEQVDKGVSRWINRTASKCFKQWQAVWRVQLKKMSKVRIAISWLSKSVLMRTLAGFKEILNERREKMLCVDVMLKQTMRRGLLGMFLGWVKIWRKYKLNEKLDGMGSNHMRSMAMRSLGGILQYWAYTARLFSLMATGRERNVRVEMRNTIRCFRRHAANARFVRAAIHNADARMRAVLSDWHQTAYAMIIVSDMFLTNTLRDVARRLRFWQRLTSSSNARELRGKYLTSRRRWYEQQQLLQLWHLFTIAKRHHRQHSSRDAMRRIGQAATNRRWQRHGTLRALGHLCKGIIYKVLTGWRLHVTTARTMRLEMLQAHASQLALDQHLRRIRARVMCKVFVSWSGRCMNKARHRRKWQAAALMIGYRRGFVQWHEATTDRSHRFMLDDAAMSHEYSSTINSAFNRWAGRAVREARHVGIFRVLVERHESGVQLRVLLAWRELLIQARRAVALRARVFDRILELVFNAWQAYTSDGVQLIDRAKSHLSRSQLTIKSEVWAAWAVKTNSIARRVRVQYVILSRREASLKRNGLIHWYGVYLRAERHTRRAANHFGFRTLGTIWSAWHAYFRSCKVRQAQIASQVDVFHRNRESWACATILVEWKAVVALHKKQKKSAREALVMLKTYTSAVHALHSRLGNATSYHLQRLSGIVFFHWRALSWSRNWEKRAEMDNEDPDVSQWQGSIASALVSGSVAFVQSAKRDFLAGKATPPVSPGKKSKHAQSAEEDVAIASHGSPTKHVNENSEALDQGVTFNDVASLLVWPGPTLQQVQRLSPSSRYMSELDSQSQLTRATGLWPSRVGLGSGPHGEAQTGSLPQPTLVQPGLSTEHSGVTPTTPPKRPGGSVGRKLFSQANSTSFVSLEEFARMQRMEKKSRSTPTKVGEIR